LNYDHVPGNDQKLFGIIKKTKPPTGHTIFYGRFIVITLSANIKNNQ